MKQLAKLATPSLLSDKPKTEIARQFGCEPSARGFLEYLMREYDLSLEEARRLVSENIELMRIMFILA